MADNNLKRFFISIVFPSILAIGFFILLIFTVILPSVEKNIMEGKKETISELANTAWSLLDEFHQEELSGQIQGDSARILAAERIKLVRYGNEYKDYFWIIDKQPVMIMHPYRPELINTDLSDYQDPNGIRLFVEATKVVSETGEGFINYMWQWKDDSTRVVPKLSYVREFEPWEWIVGTGIYLEDVQEEIRSLKIKLLRITLLFTLLISAILAFIIRQSFIIENKRKNAEKRLILSRQKYKVLVEASTEGTLMMLHGEFIYSNVKFSVLSGYDPEEVRVLSFEAIFQLDWEKVLALFDDPKKSVSRELLLSCKDGSIKEVVISVSKVSYAEGSGFIIIVKEVSLLDRMQKEGMLLTQDMQQSFTNFLITEIERAEDVQQLSIIYKRLPVLVKALLDSGRRSEPINSIITAVGDAIHKRVLRFGLHSLGEPPCDFAFMVLGSQGRGEQTLATDQDNAIIFDNKTSDEEKKYFIKLGKQVNEDLDTIGYRYCIGEVMAGNPKWNQSLQTWEEYFTTWINTSNPQDILDAAIFFDFRFLFGEEKLVNTLREHVRKVSENKSVFFYHMAQTVLKFKIPVNIFGSIVGKEPGDEETVLDIKKVMLPLVCFIRLYAIMKKCVKINSMERLEEIFSVKAIDTSSYEELVSGLDLLMRIRLRFQVNSIYKNEIPENLVDLDNLTRNERSMLKALFSHISNLQTKVNFDFKG